MMFIRVPPGEFDMGSSTAEGGRSANEILHRVKLTKGFWMQTMLVTQSQYWSIMDHHNPSAFQRPRVNAACENRPVENVSWDDAVEFCRRLSQREGKHYRLPTEAEWEYCCRAGAQTAYYFGDDFSKLGEYAWFNGNSSNGTHPVGEKRVNPWGLFDMHGNVWQWCGDWYGDLGEDDAVDPMGPPSGGSRVLRGGSWFDRADDCRSARRLDLIHGYRDNNIGFRVVLEWRDGIAQ